MCPSKWHRGCVDNLRHPLDVLADMDLFSDQVTELSQHGAWCMDVLYTEPARRTGHMQKGAHYRAISNEAYSRAGDVLLSTSQKANFDWVGAHGEEGRTPSANNQGNILDSSVTVALITEPQQTAWLRHLLLKCVEESEGPEAMSSHDRLDEPLTKDTHPHLFPLTGTS